MTVSEAAPVSPQEAEERAREEARLRLRRGRWVTAVAAGVLAVLVLVVALLGGFRHRTDLRTAVAAGSVIATGPYEVTFSSATVQHRVSSDDWSVVATGTARTTGDTSIDPLSGDAGFVFARGPAGGEVQGSSAITLGQSTGSAGTLGRSALTPGLPPVPWSVSFTFSTPPGPTLVVAVLDQEYTTSTLFSDEQSWTTTSRSSTLTLPLQELPETRY